MSQIQPHGGKRTASLLEMDTSRSMSSRAASGFSDSHRRRSAQPLRPPGNERSRNEPSADNDEEPKKNLKPLIRFLVTNIGMIVFVMLYILGGAFLFQLLEQHNEIQTCQEGEGAMSNLVISYRTKLFNYIYFNVTMNPWLPISNSSGMTASTTVKDGPDVYNPKLFSMLQTFRSDILLTRSSHSYYGQDCIVNSLWNFESAILFAVTVVTTIGYGHVTPKTWEGQIVCICYATLGIPMFLMSVANVSSILGDLFRFLYSHIFCFVCNAFLKDSEEEEAAKASKQKTKAATNEPESEWELSADGKTKKLPAAVVVDANDPNGDDDDDGRVSVPLIVVVMIFCLYTGFGGYLFKVLEDWTTVSSSYFSFVSLSTMGFGDFVPGLAKLSSGNETGIGGRNLLIASVYIFFGMAILAMCFDLIQEGLIQKFTLIGEKVGIIKKDEEEEESEKIREEVFDSGESEEAVLREKLKLQEQINMRSTPSRITSASRVMTSNDYFRNEQSPMGFKEPTTIYIKPSTSQGSNC